MLTTVYNVKYISVIKLTVKMLSSAALFGISISSVISLYILLSVTKLAYHCFKKDKESLTQAQALTNLIFSQFQCSSNSLRAAVPFSLTAV